jgi:DNA-directed RNA polymerase specialized sigma24 family protein
MARNYEYERRFLRDRIARLARGRSPADLDDLASDAWVKLDRFLAREDARNLEAIMTRIAGCVWIDHSRRRARDPVVVGLEPIVEAGAADPGLEDDSIDPSLIPAVRFCVLEFFELHQARDCHQLAQCFFAEVNWFEVARRTGERRDAIAKRWERCRRRLIDAFRADTPKLLSDLGLSIEAVFA